MRRRQAIPAAERRTGDGDIDGFRKIPGLADRRRGFCPGRVRLGPGVPPIYLQPVRDLRGWSLPLVSAAVTVHFLFGALVVARLPKLYLRYGLATVTKAGALSLAAGISGWAAATEPWQLFAAALLSGAGWVAMGAAAINAIIAPWFIRTRPAALAMAYNGASIGGVVFSPLWVAAIGAWGFLAAAVVVGAVVTIAVFILADVYFSRTPQQMGMSPDGDDAGVATVSSPLAAAKSLSGASLWKDRRFVTLAAGTALSLFAQIGLLAHLFSLLVPAVGAPLAGIHSVARCWNNPVRGRHRQRNLAAAADRSSRIHSARCWPDRRLERRHFARRLRVRAGRLRINPGVCPADGRDGGHNRALSVRCRRTVPVGGGGRPSRRSSELQLLIEE